MRALIVDDEPLSRDLLRSLLAGEPAIEVVGECATGQEAILMARALAPNLLFLDVEMPGADGFSVVEALADLPALAVIFVTAHDRYALQAFEVHAVDYLLKPFDGPRVHAAVTRAHALLAAAPAEGVDGRLLALLEELSARRRHPQRLAVRTPDRAFLLPTESIDWIESAGKHVRLHVGREVHDLREALTRLEQQLDPERFLRISRSAIVNIDRIREIQPWFQGDYVMILKDGTKLTSTRGYRESLLRLLREGR